MVWYWYNHITCVCILYHVCIYFVLPVYVCCCVYTYNSEKWLCIRNRGQKYWGVRAERFQYVYTGRAGSHVECGPHAAINSIGREPSLHAVGKYHTSHVRLRTRLVTHTTSEVLMHVKCIHELCPLSY
jgi:hypothetical protein